MVGIKKDDPLLGHFFSDGFCVQPRQAEHAAAAERGQTREARAQEEVEKLTEEVGRLLSCSGIRVFGSLRTLEIDRPRLLRYIRSPNPTHPKPPNPKP